MWCENMNYEIYETKKTNNNKTQKKYIVIDSKNDIELFAKIQKLQLLTNKTNDVLKQIVNDEIENAIKYFDVKLWIIIFMKIQKFNI